MKPLLLMALVSTLFLQAGQSEVITKPEFTATYVNGSKAAGDFDKLPWGTPSKGLDLSLDVDENTAPSVPDVKLGLRNVTDHDLLINLGIVFNQDEQRPSTLNFVLDLRDSRGETRRLKFFSRTGFVAGRLDPYIVRLTPGSIYSLAISLNRFVCLETREWSVRLHPGKNQITAQFEGRKPGVVNLDTPEMNSVNLWLGQLQSNTVTVER
jgi:hypothetical protein